MRRAAALLVLALAAASAGCGGPVRTAQLALRAEPAANAATPVPVDLVVVYDRRLVDEVAGLTAREWFERRAQIARDWPRALGVRSWEVVPGQTLPLARLPLSRRGARAAFLFADYLEPGEHRVRLDPFRAATVVLGPDDLAVQQPAR